MKKNGKHAQLHAMEKKIEDAVKTCHKTLDEIVHDACYTYATSWNAAEMLSEITGYRDIKEGIKEAVEMALVDPDTRKELNREKAVRLTEQIESLKEELAAVQSEI